MMHVIITCKEEYLLTDNKLLIEINKPKKKKKMVKINFNIHIDNKYLLVVNLQTNKCS